MKLLCKTIPFLLAGLTALAQPPRPAFEVASVKPSAATGQAYRMGVEPAGNRFSARNVPLRMLILWAYDAAEWQVSGGPAWLDSERFDIDAKPERPATREQTMVLLQTLLAERFQLALHHESKEMPGYALVVEKGGAHLTPTQSELGFQQAVRRGPPGQVTFVNVGMPRLSWFLKTQVGREVFDQTGLAGNYDFKLDWIPDNLAQADASGPSLFTAVREQLGLRLESRKGPVDFLVIDRAEKPAAN
jgi:uncharacterized protein (TIGR03435 family)